MSGKSLYVHMSIGVAALVCCVAKPALGQVTFVWATVGNPGNAEDPLNSGTVPGIGSVANEYRLAKHEVTNAQYAAFLGAVAATDTNNLYNTSMALDRRRGGITRSGAAGSFTYSVKPNTGNKPVNWVSFFDAMRFVNWLHNGQPTGAQDASTTEDGVYTITDGLSETRAPDVTFFIPTQNEWYKAAYHQPTAQGGDGDDYWLYPTSSNVVPTIATANAVGDIGNPGTKVANYADGADWNGQDGNVTTVGSAGAGSESFYRTSDQGGNVSEWTETVANNSFRAILGGSWFDNAGSLQSRFPGGQVSSAEGATFGFRVASVVPPPPPIPAASVWGVAAMVLLILSAGTIITRKRVLRTA